MFYNKKTDEKSGLDKVIDKLIADIANEPYSSEDYADMVDHLSELYKIKETEIPRRVSPDTMATVIGNLIGIILIVGHERAHVVTTKALSFIRKLG
jgi:hypothetical protein